MQTQGITEYNKLIHRIILFFFVSVLLIITACAPKAKFVKPDWKPPQKVAVLPFDNLSNDEEGPGLVRALFAEKLADKGFILQDCQETDNILRDLGITYGGQLQSISPGELARELGVDGLFYGTLMNFEYSVGILETKKYVKLNLKLIDGWRDDLFWEAEQEKNNSKSRLGALFSLNVGEIAKNVSEDLGRDIIVKGVSRSFKGFLGHPLYSEAKHVIDRTARTLPGFKPGYEPPSDNTNVSGIENKDSESN